MYASINSLHQPNMHKFGYWLCKQHSEMLGGLPSGALPPLRDNLFLRLFHGHHDEEGPKDRRGRSKEEGTKPKMTDSKMLWDVPG